MTARRPLGLPAASELRPGEQAAFDFMQTRVRGAEEANIGTIAGEPYGAAYFRALANSPVLGEALGRLGGTLMQVPGVPGTLSAADHEFIDAIIAYDNGYTWLLAGHAKLAIRAGVRLEAIEALRDGRDDLFTDDECQQIEFTRAVRDGRVNQGMWDAMVKRLGSERGAVEYTFFVLLVLFNHLLASAMGVPDMTPEEKKSLFVDLRAQPSVTYSDYSRLYGDAAFKVSHED